MPPEFNPSFQAPHWAWWIVAYFFVGGLTGGVYFAAAWLDLFGDHNDRPVVRLGHLLTFPLIILSAVFLIADLGQPLRFWHMLFQSERFPLPMLKIYSPMSLGSTILGVFGIVAFISFLDALFARDRVLHAPGNTLGKILSIVGAIGGMGLAGYTGTLLSVSNEPVWGDSPWISALFVFSGMSTGIAVLLLLARRIPRATVDKLSEADNYMMLLELVTLIVFIVTLGAVGTRFILGSPVAILFVVVVVIGLLAPLLLHWRPALAGGGRTTSAVASVLVLIGGFVLRWAMLASPQGIGL
jgi:formate-dependent nitrite reductase membrane component NrfD